MYFKERYMKNLILLIGFICLFNISYGSIKSKIKITEYTKEEKIKYLEKAIKGDKKIKEFIIEEHRKGICIAKENYNDNYFEIVKKVSIDMTDVEIVSKEFREWLDIMIELSDFEDDVDTFGYERALQKYEQKKR